MAGEQFNQEQTDEIKLVVNIMEKIRTGEAPAEIVAIYQALKPERFGYWLHGILYGLLCREELVQSEFEQFFKKIIEEN